MTTRVQNQESGRITPVLAPCADQGGGKGLLKCTSVPSAMMTSATLRPLCRSRAPGIAIAAGPVRLEAQVSHTNV
jgi:hypothetical protein